MNRRENVPGSGPDMASPVSVLKGIGPKSAQVFEKAGIFTLSDLLSYYPRRYDVFAEPVSIADLKEGETAAILAQVPSRPLTRYLRGMQITTATCSDGLSECQLTWFRMPYIASQIQPGVFYVFRGTGKKKGRRMVMDQAAVYTPEQYEALTHVMQPVYPLVRGLSNKTLRNAIRQVTEQKALLQEYLPDEIRIKNNLCEYNFAVEQIHFPTGKEQLITARNRLVFDEFFFFLLQLRALREQREKAASGHVMNAGSDAGKVLKSLPYRLTGAQERVWKQISEELAGSSVMARLIQGDVGSGKTILSFLAMITAAENGMQSALMVPTEVLASQHMHALQEVLEQAGLPWKAVLLTGSMTAKEKRIAYEQLSSGEAQMAVGTHALIQDKVEFHNLGLVITDEQHRFGVRQREALARKGSAPHTIVMSATPIPRTLAVILYGDLDISVIDELPANRLPIKNAVVGTDYREKAYRFIAAQLSLGHQAYIICPMVEESEQIEAEDVVGYTETVRAALPDTAHVEYLHGKMKPAEKTRIMEAFVAGDIDVLVSTTVVEVGVNVPNATVMMVENAERFGLAQLHQLRGRVGRGGAQSYCIFVHGTEGKAVEERLEILGKSNDGFEIASKDLKLRGPGDLFGVRQSGVLDFSLADVYTDAGMLQLANEAVTDLMETDPALELAEHRNLKRRYQSILERQTETISL